MMDYTTMKKSILAIALLSVSGMASASISESIQLKAATSVGAICGFTGSVVEGTLPIIANSETATNEDKISIQTNGAFDIAMKMSARGVTVADPITRKTRSVDDSKFGINVNGHTLERLNASLPIATTPDEAHSIMPLPVFARYAGNRTSLTAGEYQMTATVELTCTPKA